MTDIERDDMLEGLFKAARAAPEPASEALMARVLADAMNAGETMRSGAVPTAAVSKGREGWRSLLAAIGGWPAAAGLATAAVTGLWIGFSPSLGLGDAMAGLVGATTTGDAFLVDYASGYDFDFNEGDAG